MSSNDTRFKRGEEVSIVSGSYKGKMATFLELTGKCSCRVQLSHNDDMVTIRLTSIQKMLKTKKKKDSYDYRMGDIVDIIGGKYIGQEATFLEPTGKCSCKVRLNHNKHRNVVTINETSIRKLRKTKTMKSSSSSSSSSVATRSVTRSNTRKARAVEIRTEIEDLTEKIMMLQKELLHLNEKEYTELLRFNEKKDFIPDMIHSSSNRDIIPFSGY